jgi:hypothetical protein
MVAGLAGWVMMSPLHDGFRAMGVAVLADAGARCTHPTAVNCRMGAARNINGKNPAAYRAKPIMQRRRCG